MAGNFVSPLSAVKEAGGGRRRASSEMQSITLQVMGTGVYEGYYVDH